MLPDIGAWKPGDKAIWKGAKGLFRQEVTIAAVRNAYLMILGQRPEDGELVCDINHTEHGLVFSIPAGQLEPVANGTLCERVSD
jgi:hypothetical protein